MNYAIKGVFNTTSNPLSDTKDWWILDCGSNCHKSNQFSRFIEYEPKAGYLRTGDGSTRYEGIGKAVIYPIDPESGIPVECGVRNSFESKRGLPQRAPKRSIKYLHRQNTMGIDFERQPLGFRRRLTCFT
jgi:hypothetical protein